MAYIKAIDESEASGEIKEIYEKRKGHHSGKVSNIAKPFRAPAPQTMSSNFGNEKLLT